MTITTNATDAHGQLLPQYTCEGANISPPLTFSEVPNKTRSLVLILDDPDAPNGTFTHWLLYDLSPATLQLPEGSTPVTGQQGKNSFGKLGYGGPCPPNGTHRYIFKLYALDKILGLTEGVEQTTLQQAMQGHIIESTKLISTFAKQ